MAKVNVNPSGGIGILGVMFLVMFTLKLGGFGPAAALSWWIIFLPLYGPIVLISIIALVIYLFLRNKS